MKSFKMSAFDDLKKVEEEIKYNVKKAIHEKQTYKRPIFPAIIGSVALIIACILVFVQFIPKEQQMSSKNEILSLSELSVDALNPRESTYIVTSLQYNGDQYAMLKNIEIVDETNKPLSYNEHHIASRFYITSNDVEKGILPSVMDIYLQPFENIAFYPTSKSRVIFNVVLGEKYTPKTNLKLKFTYEVNNKIEEYTYSWNTLSHLTVKEFDIEQVFKEIHATDQEIEAYHALTNSNNIEALKGLTPITIARLYWLAVAEGNRELEYRLNYKDENDMQWSYEEHLNIPIFDITPPSQAMTYANEINRGTFIEQGVNSGSIEFSSNHNALFNMKKNKDGIWLVTFMPMQ